MGTGRQSNHAQRMFANRYSPPSSLSDRHLPSVSSYGDTTRSGARRPYWT